MRRRSRGELVLGEEDDSVEQIVRNGWVIDPTDGTRAWAAGQADFSIAIAYLEDARVVAAMVFFPYTGGGVRYIACDSLAGAWRDKTAIRVCSRPVHRPARLLVAGGGVDGAAEPNACTPLWTAVIRPDGRLEDTRAKHPIPAHRRICSVADGGFAATVYSGTGGWDVAASAYVAQKAGATVIDVDGNPHDFSIRSINGAVVACDERLARGLLAQWRSSSCA